MNKVIWLCFGLAVAAAVVYLLSGSGVLSSNAPKVREYASAIPYIASACYLVGGLLILLKKRWLWIIGAVINALVIGIFYSFYMAQPAIMLSVPGLATKISEILLEAGLIYLILNYKQAGLGKESAE
ncbi:MAG: hypothetical protein PHO26_00305 [Dehalococcoidia bacterium]|nr:hypothetical protein [Dehalococcoidia bacterium]MDD5494192.1 hypothetical protein [Dehalococcoidia bacterium]